MASFPLPRWLSLPAALALAACGAEAPSGLEAVGEAAQADTVAQVADATCSTVSVKGLSEQIITVADCLAPGAFVLVPDKPNLSLGEAVFPYLEEPARDALAACLDAHPGAALHVTSMLRTVAQQYLLYRWYQNQQCNIGLAASPGHSNHESGLAFDTSDHVAWQDDLTTCGFHWLGASDPVHFDYAGPGAVDYKGTDVLAFQQLWNANHPEDVIDEDGIYGPQTQARIEASPADGFPTVPSCGPSYAAQYVSDSYRMTMTAGETVLAELVLENTGTKAWDASTRLGTTSPRDRESPFAAPDWPAPNRLSGVAGTVAPGESYAFSFSLVAPSEPGTYVERWGLVQEGVTWFADDGGPADDALAFTITVSADPATGAGGAGGSDETGGTGGAGGAFEDTGSSYDAGSCECGLADGPGGEPAAAFAAAIAALAFARRRRPRDGASAARGACY